MGYCRISLLLVTITYNYNNAVSYYSCSILHRVELSFLEHQWCCVSVRSRLFQVTGPKKKQAHPYRPVNKQNFFYHPPADGEKQSLSSPHFHLF